MPDAMTVANPWIRSGSRRTEAIADRKKWNVIFPTKLNLMKLAHSATVAEAVAAAHASEPLPVTPWTEQTARRPDPAHPRRRGLRPDLGEHERGDVIQPQNSIVMARLVRATQFQLLRFYRIQLGGPH